MATGNYFWVIKIVVFHVIIHLKWLTFIQLDVQKFIFIE